MPIAVTPAGSCTPTTSGSPARLRRTRAAVRVCRPRRLRRRTAQPLVRTRRRQGDPRGEQVAALPGAAGAAAGRRRRSVPGVLALTVPEALWLADHGVDDIVVGYPSVDRRALSAVATRASSGPPEPGRSLSWSTRSSISTCSSVAGRRRVERVSRGRRGPVAVRAGACESGRGARRCTPPSRSPRWRARSGGGRRSGWSG